MIRPPPLLDSRLRGNDGVGDKGGGLGGVDFDK